jgi:flagellar biosynthesis protein FlhF
MAATGKREREMKIKRFTAKDMRDAIRQVREEQGPDAVILSNRRVDGQVEVVAATDYDEALVQQALRAAPRKPGEARAPAAPAPPLALPPDPALGAVHRELAGLRVLVQRQTAAFALNQMKLSPGRAEAYDQLDRIGVEAPLAQELVASIPREADADTARRLPLGLLARHIPVTEEDPIDRGGVIALVGPTGAGKTTTIAKLAARYGARHGLRNMALVTTDHYRVGAREQLYTYGRLLGVPVHEAATPAELSAVLGRLKDYPLVLVDTAGLSPADRQLAQQLKLLAPVRHFLVLPANCQAADLHDTVARYQALAPAACIVTKLDETTRLGGALSVAVRRRLPVAYVCDGQRVPEDLHLARSHRLVLRALQPPARPQAPAGGRAHAAA